MKNGKGTDQDGITAKIMKAGFRTYLRSQLHQILLQYWGKGTVPQELRDAKLITLYKNKGDRSDSSNYRGISLLNVVVKVFARVVLKRLKNLAERVYPETQWGFRAGRSTIGMIFSLRQLQVKCREQNKPLYVAIVDLTKAFEMVSGTGLNRLLKKIGCPPRRHARHGAIR